MTQRKSSSVRTFLLLCLLALGPLQAQVGYACAMMDTVVHGDCCCEDYAGEADRLRAERETPAEGEHTPCCEVAVEIAVDQDTRQHTPAFKPPSQRCDLDLSPALITTFDPPPPSLRPPASNAHFSDRSPPDGGSDTWLVTRRLRI